MFAEYITIHNETNRVEVRELTQVQAENLSEMARVVSLAASGGKVTVWRDRKPSTVAIDTGALMELKRRAVWYGEHEGMLS